MSAVLPQLRHVARFAYGDSLPAQARENGDVPVFGSNGQVGVHSRPNTRGPVVVIGRKGSFGKVQYSDVPVFAIDTTYFVDSTLTSHNLRWLYYVLQTLHLDKLSQDVGVPGLSREAAYRTRARVVTPEEQARIVRCLDGETERIDALMLQKRRFAAVLDERHKALVQRLVVGDGNRSPVPLMHLVDPARPVMYGIVLPGPNVAEGVLLVKGGDVEAERLSPAQLARTTVEIEAPYARSRLREGDLLVSIRGSVGAVAQVPASIDGANITQDAARVAPRDGVHPRWLFHALKSEEVFGQLAARVTGATVKGVNIRDLKRVKLPVPNYERQAAIAQELDSALELHRALSERSRRQVALMEERRRSIIASAVAAEHSHEAGLQWVAA